MKQFIDSIVLALIASASRPQCRIPSAGLVCGRNSRSSTYHQGRDRGSQLQVSHLQNPLACDACSIGMEVRTTPQQILERFCKRLQVGIRSWICVRNFKMESRGALGVVRRS